MKKIITTIVMIVTAILYVSAVPADPTPIVFTQPNGESVTIIHKGDEFSSWYETLDHQVVVFNNGYWVYATVKNAEIVPSGNIAKEPKITTQNVQIPETQSSARREIVKILNERRRVNVAAMRSSLISMPTDTAVGTGVSVNTENAPNRIVSSGSYKLLTILIQFTDVKFKDQANVRQRFENMMNQPNFTPENSSTPSGSVKEFWNAASYGKLNLTSVVVGPYTANNTQAHFGKGENGYNTRTLAYQAIMAADKDLDMRQFDNNGDGTVDGVQIIFAGPGQETQGEDSEDKYIWSHRWEVYSSAICDGKTFRRYCMIPELYTGNTYTNIGVSCHELGHIFGATDFYDTDEVGDEFMGTGDWDLMAGGSWNNSGRKPAHPNPWLKTTFWGWTTQTTLSGENRLYTLYPTETHSGQIYKLPTAGGDYYLLENKQQDYINDNYSSSYKGLVMFHVHKDLKTSANDPNDGHPQMLYVVNPHSTTAIPGSTPNSYGDYFANRSFTNPNNPKPFFTSTTTPNNLGWTGQALSSKKDITMIRQETINGVNVVKFVLNPTIAGDTKFCDDEYFEVNNAPTSAEVSWGERNVDGTQSTNKMFVITRENNRKAKYNRLGYGTPGGGMTYPTGSMHVCATIAMNGQTYALPNKLVNLTPLEDVEFSGPNMLPSPFWLPGQARTYSIDNPIGSGSAVMWILEGSAMHSTKTLYGESVKIIPDKYGSLRIRVVDGNGCSPYNEAYEDWQIRDMQIMIQRNPTSGQATMTAYVVSETGTSGGDRAYATTVSTGREEYMGAYSIELWHSRFGRVRAIDVAENTPTTHFDLAGLAPDQYTVRLIVDGQVRHTAQLLVR